MEARPSGSERMKKQTVRKNVPERWYEVFGMGKRLPLDFDPNNILRIPGHYFMRF
jgi:hypothetical protein